MVFLKAKQSSWRWQVFYALIFCLIVFFIARFFLKAANAINKKPPQRKVKPEKNAPESGLFV
jgi:phosphotransferase system  glucose/maltose/N-acetylglucosamine-specific IIC component